MSYVGRSPFSKLRAVFSSTGTGEFGAATAATLFLFAAVAAASLASIDVRFIRFSL
jgi:hypothetical protein